MSTVDSVNAIIASGRSEASKLVDAAISYAEAAQTAASSVITSIGTIPTPAAPSITVPTYSNPNADLSDLFTTTFDATKQTFGAEFGAAFEAFIDQFFPTVDGVLQSVIDDWLYNTIKNGGTGLPANIENAIWQRSRSREADEASRQKSSLIKGWAGRGFTLPPGVMVEGISTIDQDLANKVSTHSRDVAIKAVELEIENIRFAIQNGIQLRLGAISAALDYLRALMAPWQMADSHAQLVAAAKQGLWNSSNAYYNALVSAESLKLRHQELLMERGERLVDANLRAVISEIDGRIKAAVSSAETLASAASSALSAQVSLGQLAYQQIEEA